ncbi:MAG: hypothetical protein NDI94_01075 [Candidatus Woesearchaeota archaeon]|nr:hypothetical protein [Candidatus Woesearchaeota archaeon]
MLHYYDDFNRITYPYDRGLKRWAIPAAAKALSLFEGNGGILSFMLMGSEPLHDLAAIMIEEINLPEWKDITLKPLFLGRKVIGFPGFCFGSAGTGRGLFSLEKLLSEDRFSDSRGNNTPEEIFQYLVDSQLFTGEKIIIGDLGFYGSIHNMVYQIIEKIDPAFHSKVLEDGFCGYLMSMASLDMGGRVGTMHAYNENKSPVRAPRLGESLGMEKLNFIKALEEEFPHSQKSPNVLIYQNGTWNPDTNPTRPDCYKSHQDGLKVLRDSVLRYYNNPKIILQEPTCQLCLDRGIIPGIGVIDYLDELHYTDCIKAVEVIR